MTDEQRQAVVDLALELVEREREREKFIPTIKAVSDARQIVFKVGIRLGVHMQYTQDDRSVIEDCVKFARRDKDI